MTVLKLVDPIYTILMEFEPLRELLETLYDRYNRTEFIAPDPISVPHRFEGREDREIAGFLSATIAWGNRRAIVGNACRMMSYMDNADPFGEAPFVDRQRLGLQAAEYVPALDGAP